MNRRSKSITLALSSLVALHLAPAAGSGPLTGRGSGARLPSTASSQQRRLLTLDDMFALADVGDPQVSPDGEWVAFTVSMKDAERDRADTDIWMVPLSGGEALRLTTSDESESRPRWSPDGRFLAFQSARGGERSQVWLLPRAGGEAFQLTEIDQGVSSFEWSPDGTRLALVLRDPADDDGELTPDGGDERAPEPIVVTRLQFKRDGAGYLDERRQHLYVYDVGSREVEQVTDGPYDDGSPAWSPDGELIAFVSNRTPEPDANDNTDIFVVAARPGATPRQLTSSAGSDGSPSFSPDGGFIAYTAGGDPADIWYSTNDIAVVPVRGDEPAVVLTEGLDRNVGSPEFDRNGEAVAFVLEDSNVSHLARVPGRGGEVVRVVAGSRAILGFAQGPADELVVLESRPDYPREISRVDKDGSGNARLTRLTHVNDDLLAAIELAPVRLHQATSSEGTNIDFFLTRPPRAPEGQPLPTLLRIHGGPVSQFEHAFSFEWQLFAANGYAVVAANPRGSSGRGRDFSRAIWADWGNRDFDDVMAATDAAIAMGVADPERLGVGGWSYGGILTNYVITRTGRFKAAISGASEVNYTANYGHDHYQHEWETELGLPWENLDLWVRLSPFFHVADVTTPTLVMCGQQDWNVPLQNSDQLYQALRRLGVPTELVVYPGQSHGISRPSYQVDRYERYLAWYDRWVKGESTR